MIAQLRPVDDAVVPFAEFFVLPHGNAGPRKVADNMLPVSASLLLGETVAAEEAADVRDVHRGVTSRTHLLAGHRHRAREWRGNRRRRGGRSRRDRWDRR